MPSPHDPASSPPYLLRVADEDFDALLKSHLDGYVLVNPNGRLVGANEAYLRLSGYTLVELLQLDIHALDALETPGETRQRTERILAEGWDRFESRHRRKNGTSFPVEVSTRLLPQRNLLIGFIRDLSERDAAEAALRESAVFYRELMEHLGEGVSMVDPEEQFTMANPAAERIFGVAPGNLVGRSLYDFLDEEGVALVQSQTRLRRSGQSGAYELRIRRPDGSRRVLQATVTPRFDGEGRFCGSLGITRDLTEELRDREALRLAQKMEGLGNLAGGLAHDMNNVLGAILGLASTHLDQEGEGTRLRNTFETIQKACLRGRNMVKALLDFSRKDMAGERSLDLNALVTEQVELLRPTLPSLVHLEHRLDPAAGLVLGDADALSLMIMNLCGNAVDAMPNGGILLLSTRNLEDGRVLLTVADTGTGMTPETLEHATEPFFTTKPQGKGTGLGLSLAYSTVKAHHGELVLHSRPAHGTRVEVLLPRVDARATLVEAPAPRVDSSMPSGQVLLVDDDDLIQSAVASQLEALGQQLTSAISGEAAMALIERGFRPDVVILDMNMPGWGGARTLPRLRAALPETPILLSTGRADQRALELARAFPGVSILPKPFALGDLQAALLAVRSRR